MAKGQSRGQAWVGPYGKDDTEAPYEQSYEKRGQSAKQDFAGPYSKEVPRAPQLRPVEQEQGPKFKDGQGWHGPYTDNKGWDD
jgi:hypothetical protein